MFAVITQRCLSIEEFVQTDEDEMANIVDTVQTDPLGAV